MPNETEMPSENEFSHEHTQRLEAFFRIPQLRMGETYFTEPECIIVENGELVTYGVVLHRSDAATGAWEMAFADDAGETHSISYSSYSRWNRSKIPPKSS